MSLQKITIENIRNLKNASLDINRRLSLIIGPNGAGKTSILEAINLLGSGKSFRTNKLQDVLRSGSHTMRVTAETGKNSSSKHHIGWQYSAEGRQLSLDGNHKCKSADIARLIPIRCVQPDSHYRFRQESRFRRSLLDWGVFHVEPSFQEYWQQYQRAYKQRNKYLKNQQVNGAMLVSWDKQLNQCAERIDLYRQNYINLWKPYIQGVLERIFKENLDTITIEYDRGWQQGSLVEQLNRDRLMDIKKGITHSGSHRADISIKYNGTSASSYASQGQQKILYLSLVLAQIELFLHTENQYGVTLMLDDVPSELDQEHREQLMQYLINSPIQTLITTTDHSHFDANSQSKYAVFHVEHGEIMP